MSADQTEKEKMWEKLSTLPRPPGVDAGYFYAPYIPIMKNNNLVVTVDVS